MKKYYAYTRVSTAKQGEGASLEAQKSAIQTYAAKNKLEISKWFEEKETAAKDVRPIFNQLISDLRRGRADGLVVHKIDRSARNFRDWAKIGDLCEAGCDVHFAFESLDLNSRGGRLAADIQAVVAADYIRNLRHESIKGQHMRLQQGFYPYQAPLGYVDNGKAKHKSICPVRGPLVRRMFELYASGEHSIRSLTTEMVRLGLTTRHNRPVTKTSIEQMLKNPFYAGVVKIRRTGKTYEGQHQPLITAQLFADVTAQRSGGRCVQKQTRRNHTFRGLWRCGLCNQSMIPELQKGHVYYRCQNRSCETKCVVEKQIDQAVLTLLSRYGLSQAQCIRIEKEVLEFLKNEEKKASVDQARSELRKLEAREARLNDKLLDGLVDDKLYSQLRETLLHTKAKQRELIEIQDQTKVSAEYVSEFLERAKNLYLSYLSATPGDKREIVKCTTSNRLVVRKNIELEPQNWLVTLHVGEVSKIVDLIRSQIEQEKSAPT